jgi:hypothetical protein
MYMPYFIQLSDVYRGPHGQAMSVRNSRVFAGTLGSPRVLGDQQGSKGEEFVWPL